MFACLCVSVCLLLWFACSVCMLVGWVGWVVILSVCGWCLYAVLVRFCVG